MASKRKRMAPQVRVISEASVGPEAGAGSVGEVGRLVDSSQADDRRMIALVRERPLLYARNNMPVASYYTQVKTLWHEVANEMGWTVADVRRKWSHIRNSYSRHLRNEMYGVRTGRGRMVSKWYLADELDFLREHMATDTRPSRYSYSPLYLDIKPSEEGASSSDSVDFKPFLPNPWLSALAGQTPPDPAPEPLVSLNEPTSPGSFEPDENSAYFQFFRGIYNDYQELPPPKQRLFRRQCLTFLHSLLDEEDAGTRNSERGQRDAMNLSNSVVDSDEDNKICVIEGVVASETKYKLLPK
ncbi:unnamed protein product [Arctia plantaginis]|uniref:MADF domain-containing protein n=1 Tax=Arctia plantaginis TaxID=874455 RepID=A0A8S0ZAM2_ARCPL|nr:unnamed protein product [Arctia plantaginis]